MYEVLYFSKSYIANSNKIEDHPSVDFVGQETVDWFALNFGLNSEETVALMGAHTLGGLDPRNSMFKYFWSKSEETYLNNRYYQSLTGKATHALNCIKDNSGKLTHVKVGGVDGSAAQVRSYCFE